VNLAEKLVMRSIGALVPYASNSRTHRPEQNFQNREKRRRLRVHQSHPGAQKRLRTALCGASAPGLRRQDGFAETAFAETARFILPAEARAGNPDYHVEKFAAHLQSLGVDPVITPAYHRVRSPATGPFPGSVRRVQEKR
jgi:hypothetical protein